MLLLQSRLGSNTFPDRKLLRVVVGCKLAYSFKKAKSGPINHKVNLKKVSLVDGNFDVRSVDGRTAAQP